MNLRNKRLSDEEFFKEKQEAEEQDGNEKRDQSNESKTNGDEDPDDDFQSFIEQFIEGGLQNE